MLMVGRRAEDKSTEVARGAIPRTFRLMLGLSIALVLVVGLLMARLRSETGADGTERPLPVLKPVPEFSLTQRDGRTITPEALRGSVWVANFFFTSCTGPCPELSLRMRSLQEGIRKHKGEVKLVSFSVDPTYDTPAVLSAYAERHGADPNLWWFVTTADEAEMHALVKEGFLQALSPAAGGSPIIHTTQIVLVDKQGRIRAWYDGLDPDSKGLVLRDVKRLLAEPAS